MKVKEKRRVRGYKITDTDYKRAMKRAKRSRSELAPIIEQFVIRYGKIGFTTVEFLEYHPYNADNVITQPKD